MAAARPARIEDLGGLLELYAAVDFSAAVSPLEKADAIWRETLESGHTTVFVLERGNEIVATCTLITAPNLLRGGRRHGFLENVATHPAHRGQGFGKAVVNAAIEHAWSVDCHHILMQSGRADPGVHSFYEAVGFQPGLRIGYVAMRR